MVLFCVKKNGWGWENFISEANSGKGKHISNSIRGYMTYVIPIIICYIYLKGYYDTFSQKSTLVLCVWMAIAIILLGLVLWSAFSCSKSSSKK